MAYKNPEDQKRYQREWHQRNKERRAANRKDRTPEERERTRERTAERRLAMIGHLGGCCVACGSDDSNSLEFDHKDCNKKTVDVSNVLTLALENIKTTFAEEGIQLLCVDCHKEKTRQERYLQRGKDTVLSQDEVDTIRARKANGESYREIAKDYPVSHVTISHVVNRKNSYEFM